MSAWLTSPSIYCWSRAPKLLLPDMEFSATSPGGVEGVLRHELAHAVRRDHWWRLLAEVGACVLWWQPLIWMARQRVYELSEQACDDWALAHGPAAHDYASALLGFAPAERSMLMPAAVSTRRSLVRRIDRMMHMGGARPTSGRGWLIGLVTIASVVLAGGAMAHRRPLVVRLAEDQAARAAEAAPVRAVTGVVDLGVVEAGGVGRGFIWLVNSGERGVTLIGSKASCGCTTVEDDGVRRLEPGETVRLRVTMTVPEEPGTRKSKRVTFFFEGQGPVEVEVRVTAADGR
jgi:hypothetical protein